MNIRRGIKFALAAIFVLVLLCACGSQVVNIDIRGSHYWMGTQRNGLTVGHETRDLGAIYSPGISFERNKSGYGMPMLVAPNFSMWRFQGIVFLPWWLLLAVSAAPLIGVIVLGEKKASR